MPRCIVAFSTDFHPSNLSDQVYFGPNIPSTYVNTAPNDCGSATAATVTAATTGSKSKSP